MSYYSGGMPYLDDFGQEETREAECAECGIEEEVEGMHYLDSESFRWQCRCGYLNEIAAPVETVDPDLAYKQMREAEQFGD